MYDYKWSTCIYQTNQNHFTKRIWNVKWSEIHYTFNNVILRNCQESWVILHQTTYLTSKLEEFQMSNCNPFFAPMQIGVCLSDNDCPFAHDDEQVLTSYPYF